MRSHYHSLIFIIKLKDPPTKLSSSLSKKSPSTTNPRPQGTLVRGHKHVAELMQNASDNKSTSADGEYRNLWMKLVQELVDNFERTTPICPLNNISHRDVKKVVCNRIEHLIRSPSSRRRQAEELVLSGAFREIRISQQLNGALLLFTELQSFGNHDVLLTSQLQV